MFSDLPLHPALLKALDKLGLQIPTPVQEAVIPKGLEGRDLQVSAETGSGKTAAFLLPVLHRLMQHPSPHTATRCLILAPTRELAAQILKDCRDLSSFSGVKAELIIGGDKLKEQMARIRKNPDIVIGTPGRVLEHVQKKSIELGDLEVLVLDEADRMLDMGFREDVMAIAAACKATRQSYLLSATLDHQGIQGVAARVLTDPEILALASAREKHGKIHQQCILCDDPSHKERVLTWLLAHENYRKALVFCNTKTQVEKLAGLLRYHKLDVAALHGDFEQEQRQQVMSLFRGKKIKILVATDLAARGLDVKGVDLVLNFSLARSGDEYVHRIGRTGRAGEEGLAISLIGPQEWNLMQSIERYTRAQLEPRQIKGLEARFKGPKAKSGAKKSVVKKEREKEKQKLEKKKADKKRQRHRVKKNVGKRRRPSAEEKSLPLIDGDAPLTRK